MVLKSISLGLAVALMLAWGGAASAEDYRPDEFLGLDLSKAVLSPKRLGPAGEFAPVRVEAKTEQPARAALTEAPKKIASERVKVAEPKIEPRVAHARSAEPRGAARTRLAHRHGNPLDAEAMDTRIQTWPCKTGGICNWKR